MSDGAMLISVATQRNWGKLRSQTSERLKQRANKTRSAKLVVPDSYISNDGLDAIVSQVMLCACSNVDVFYHLCVQKIRNRGSSINVNRFIAEYSRDAVVDISVPRDLLADTERDWLGYLYQMRVTEGQRNLRGQYYTNAGVVRNMLAGVVLGHDKSLFDPCCGTGAFLMNANAGSLAQLYGVDIDEVAVMIAKANLIALFPDDAMYPQVYCEDYLEDSFFAAGRLSSESFDHIYTNPPWGICKTRQYVSDVIRTGERASLFFAKAYGQLKTGGRMGFLMPTSLIKIKAHSDFRSFVLRKTKIDAISLFSERFNGVFTDFFSISVSRRPVTSVQSYCVRKGDSTVLVTKALVDGDTEIELNASEEQEIMAAMEARGLYNLGNSIWALGIVTGDNKNKLKETQEHGTEAIYTGKDISRYVLKVPSKYIHYDRSQLQQCAKDEYYRSPEKLVYKFISKSLCFAYDNSASLFLNSANILIPRVQGMSIKTVLAFLNSELFSYYYSKKYADIKILKGNLMTLPFPEITERQDVEMTAMVDHVLDGEKEYVGKIDEYIYALYGFSATIANKVKQELYGNIDFSA